ncbi:hypothetical protein DRP98_06115 [candidate division KSB1 bacterium]|nr:MAG: hypothetical protein DRP98_06115 [candidate division KSB1 bacterium]
MATTHLTQKRFFQVVENLHDLNNLMTALYGSICMNLEEETDRKRKERIKFLKQLVKDGMELLQEARLVIKKSKLPKKVKFDIRRIISDSVRIVQNMSGLKDNLSNIEIFLTHDRRRIDKILGYPYKLREVFINLLKNAIEAIPDSGKIEVTTRTNRQWVYITIVDTGSGIRSDYLNKVFDPYFSSKPDYGTGLGLSICKRIISEHNGMLDIESTEGVGTTVKIALPLWKTKDKNFKMERHMNPTSRPKCSFKILLIDDEEVVIKILQRILEKRGHSVIWAGSGSEGIQVIENNGNFDVIFIDLMLPDCSGINLAKRIKDLIPQAKIVLLTGWVDKLDKSSIKACGISDILYKPFEINRVLKVVANDVTA